MFYNFKDMQSFLNYKHAMLYMLFNVTICIAVPHLWQDCKDAENKNFVMLKSCIYPLF